ncbi:homocysteine S-methyltransferase [Balneatrix alpica]|uniref:Homocysteine S-methyltransferase n=1 Tax=Balneatrix alpica TaxID=75684 RepID=A0ABV5ZGR5_9GAMM|nr:homocysteine S-methyltransferase [Balneatrix alpica]
MSIHLPELLARHQRLLVDGALATELEARGCHLNDPLWSAKVLLEQPELIEAVHYDYFAAGADIGISASYQASIAGFVTRGYSAEQALELIKLSVKLLDQARQRYWQSLNASEQAQRPRPLVAGSVGPYGAMLADGSEYRGQYGVDEATLMDFHRPRIQALLAAGADLLACETLPSLSEALALAKLLAREFATAEAWISFSCRDGLHTCEGQLLRDAVQTLEPYPQIIAVGINCSAPEFIPSLLQSVAGHTSKALLVYPNSGEHYDPQQKCWHGQGDTLSFAQQAEQWQQLGAQLIGGCCRTGPADIAALAKMSPG